MGMFAGIEDVQVQKVSRFVEPGNYQGTINAVKYGRTNQEEKPYFVVEVELTESDNEEFREGDLVTWMTMLHKFKHYFLEEVKDFVASVTKSSPEEVTEEVVEFVTGEDQPLSGALISIRSWAETNKKSGKTFTRSEFRRLDN